MSNHCKLGRKECDQAVWWNYAINCSSGIHAINRSCGIHTINRSRGIQNSFGKQERTEELGIE